MVCLLALLQCALRFAIPAMIMLGGGPSFERPVSGEMAAFVSWMFVVIGAVGLLTTYGLWKMRRWGYEGAIFLSMATIVFDIWAVNEIQLSAAIGIVLPVVFIAYLLLIRADFPKEAGTNEGARGVWN